MTPAQKRLKDMLALISANTKRIARGLPPLVEVSRPRVVSVKRKPRRKKRTSFMPPRAPEVVVEPVFKPTPPRPVRAVASETPPPAPSPAVGNLKASCKAVCASTGWPCLLPEHGETAHRHKRGAFALVAAPGQKHFSEREVDRYAFASTIDAGMGEVRKGYAAEKQASRDRLASGVRLRRAHLGFANTEGGDRDERARWRNHG